MEYYISPFSLVDAVVDQAWRAPTAAPSSPIVSTITGKTPKEAASALAAIAVQRTTGGPARSERPAPAATNPEARARRGQQRQPVAAVDADAQPPTRPEHS